MEEKECYRCGEVKPLSEFRKDSNYEDGKSIYCKECGSILIKNHYVKFTTKEFYQRGRQGALCPLWSEKCGVCVDWQECWRIADVGGDEYPSPKLSVRKELNEAKQKGLRKSRFNADDLTGGRT